MGTAKVSFRICKLFLGKVAFQHNLNSSYGDISKTKVNVWNQLDIQVVEYSHIKTAYTTYICFTFRNTNSLQFTQLVNIFGISERRWWKQLKEIRLSLQIQKLSEDKYIVGGSSKVKVVVPSLHVSIIPVKANIKETAIKFQFGNSVVVSFTLAFIEIIEIIVIS